MKRILHLILARCNAITANVIRLQFVFFLGPPLLLAAVLFRWSGWLSLSFFGLFVLLWALIFPLHWRLPRNAADFWYYLLVGIGAVLFFVSDADQREKIELEREINRGTIELASVRDKRVRAAAIAREPRRFFDDVRKAAGMAAALLNDPMLQAYCNQAAALKRLTPGSHQLGLSMPTPGDAICEDLNWQATLESMAAAQTADELAAILTKADAKRLERIIPP